MTDINILYDLTERKIAIPSEDQLKRLLTFDEQRSLEIRQETIAMGEILDGVRLDLDITVFKNGDRISIAITALIAGEEAGYMDFYLVKDSYSVREEDGKIREVSSVLASAGGNFVNKGKDMSMIRAMLEENLQFDPRRFLPGSIRYSSELSQMNGLNVMPSFRSIGLGAILLFSCFQCCQMLRADIFQVNDSTYPFWEDDYPEKSYYSRFLTIKPRWQFLAFPLSDEGVKLAEENGYNIVEP